MFIHQSSTFLVLLQLMYIHLTSVKEKKQNITSLCNITDLFTISDAIDLEDKLQKLQTVTIGIFQKFDAQ